MQAEGDVLTLFDGGLDEPLGDDGHLTAFRYCDYDVPFWARPNSRAGRWNRHGDPPTQYWSLTPAAAWAELIRHEELRIEEDLGLIRMPFWVCRVPCAGLLDLRDDAHQRQIGLKLEDFLSGDWTACQGAAATLRQECRGILTPSAAFDRATNLTLFGARRAIALDQRPKLASAVPSAPVSIGRPPEGILPYVLPLVDAPSLF